MNKKRIAVLMAVMLLIGVASGATLAWLKASATPVRNVFTVGDITLTLAETVEPTFHFVPGDELDKDPKVTVGANSENCYVFVKIDVANNQCTDADGVTADPIITWAFNDTNWTTVYEAQAVAGTDYYNLVPLEDQTKGFLDDGTYYLYLEHTKASGNTVYEILASNKVTLSADVTKGMVEKINASAAKDQLAVSFNAAAVQSDNLAEAEGDVTPLMKVMKELPDNFIVVND